MQLKTMGDNRIPSCHGTFFFQFQLGKSLTDITVRTACVHVTLDDAVSEQKVLKAVSMTQLPINMNDATTGHKLQGMSKDKLIVESWSFISNWIYVVLSRVRTLECLF